MNWWFYGSLGGTLLLGVLLFFYLASRKKYRDKSAAENYEKIREKVTVRETPKEEDTSSESTSGGGILGNLIGAFITILIGLIGITILPEVINQSANVTGASSTLLNLVPLFFGFAIAMGALGMVYTALRNSDTI